MATVDLIIPAHPDNYKAVTGRSKDLVVVHDMEYPEKDDSAEWCARYFARPGLQASAHYCVDNDSVVRSVKDEHVAYCAPGANHNGLHIELAGYARQTQSEWLDVYGRAMLLRTARLTAELCKQYGIPRTFIGVSGLQAGQRGITTHAAVSMAFRRSTHTDPGFNFPMDWFMAQVVNQYSLLDKPWPVPIPKWFWPWAGWKKAGSPEGERPESAPPPGIQWAPGGKYYWAWTRLRAMGG